MWVTWAFHGCKVTYLVLVKYKYKLAMYCVILITVLLFKEYSQCVRNIISFMDKTPHKSAFSVKDWLTGLFPLLSKEMEKERWLGKA